MSDANEWRPIETVPHDRTVRVSKVFKGVGANGPYEIRAEYHAAWNERHGALLTTGYFENEIEASHWQEIIGPNGERETR